jgi:hypothetical protein
MSAGARPYLVSSASIAWLAVAKPDPYWTDEHGRRLPKRRDQTVGGSDTASTSADHFRDDPGSDRRGFAVDSGSAYTRSGDRSCERTEIGRLLT